MIPLTKEEWKKNVLAHGEIQRENWRRHFKEHPEQLLPGAEVKRTIPMAEIELWTQVVGGCPVGPDDGEWTEVVDH